jgi:hypothetical protein
LEEDCLGYAAGRVKILQGTTIGNFLNRMYRNIHSWTRFKDDLLCFEEFFKNYFCSEEIRKALSDLDSDTLRRIFLDDDASEADLLLFSDVRRRIAFGRRVCPETRFFDLGYWALPDHESKRRRLLSEVSSSNI